MAILFLQKGEYFFMLKKVLVFFSAIIIITSLFFIGNEPVFNSYAKNYEIYLDSCSNSKKIINVNNRDCASVLGKKGESVYVEKQTFELHSFLLEMSARVIFIEEIEGKVSYYAYSPKIKYIQQVKGHNINLQIVVGDNMVKVGSPLIYGSF